MKQDTVEQFLKDESFCLLPLMLLAAKETPIDSDGIKRSCILQYKDMIFWIEDNKLQIQTLTTRFVKDLQDVLSFPPEFKAIQFFDNLIGE